MSQELQPDALKGGKEHRVALLPDQNFFLKAADARKLILVLCLVFISAENAKGEDGEQARIRRSHKR